MPFSKKTLLAAVFAAAAALPARAVVTWDAGGGDGNWYTPKNWSGDAVPGAGDDVTIDQAVTVTVDASSPAIGFNSLTVGGANNATLVLSTGIAVPDKDLTIKLGSTLIQASTQVLTFGNVTVEGLAFIAHSSNTATVEHLVNINASGNFDLQIGAEINVSSKGFAGGASGSPGGPGAGTGGGGAGISAAQAGGAGGGHGGHGGRGGDGTAPESGSANGSIAAPADLGSGGGGAWRDDGLNVAPGGAGGGTVILKVAGTLSLNGKISANGEEGAVGAGGQAGRGAGGGGSGGTINITAATLSGTGVLRAAGAAGGTDGDGGDDPGAGGAGGRIAVTATGTDTSNLTMITQAGPRGGGSAQNGGGGTAYAKDPTQTHYDLIIGAGSVVASTGTPLTADITVDTLTVTNANLVGDPGVILTVAGDINTSGQNVIDVTTINFTSDADFTPAAGTRLVVSSLKVYDFTLVLGASITHRANTTAKTHWLEMTVLNDFDLQTGAVIDVSSRGYAGGASGAAGAAGNGSGGGAGGASASQTGGAGGGHGGAGGNGGDGATPAGGSVNDSPTNPSDLGSGGGGASHNGASAAYPGGAGGGALILTVGGTLTLNGRVDANGGTGTAGAGADQGAGGGGAGGTVNITAGTLAGVGEVRADGAPGGADADDGDDPGGGGGGGIVAVSVGGTNNATLAAMTSAGGASGGGSALAGADGVLPAAPGAVVDIAVSAVVSTGLGASSVTVTLTWTAPALGAAGGANAGYDLRYDTNPILSPADYNAARNTVLLSTTVTAAAAETVTLQFLDAAATHYFAVVMNDSFGLRGSLSNAATALSYVIGYGGGGDERGVAWGDYDNDGDLDFVVARNGDNTLGTNNGDGTFSLSSIADTAGNDAAVAWGDFDGDGDLDIGLNDRVMRNDGGGAFTALFFPVPDWSAAGIAWGDLDNDGAPELIVTSASVEDYVVTWRGGTTFSTAAIAGTNVNSQSVAPGDYNNDGYLDLAVVTLGAGDYIARNNGDGTFSTFTFTSGNDYRSVSWGDFDGDGDLDLAMAKNPGIDLLRNDGGGAFSEIWIPQSSDYATSAVWGDYDNDGDLDLFVAASGVDQYILQNDGGGNFTKITLAGSAGGMLGSSWGDFDGDGDLDAIGGGERIYRNDAQLNHGTPSVPAGYAQYFDEYSASSSSGVLRLEWDDAYDAETTDADLLEYFVRVGTSSGGGEIMPYPARFSPDGYSGAGFLYSTRGSTVTGKRGIKLILAKETTVYWDVGAVDAEFTRGSRSTEREAWLSAPSPITDLSAVWVSTGLGASTMTVTLTWTAPGANGTQGVLAGGKFDLRYSTVEPIGNLMNYSTVSYQVVIGTSVSPGEPQTYIVDYLDASATHYFAITTIDEFGVRSALSNPATALSYIVIVPGSANDTRDVAWGDFDRDGDLDLAAANSAAASESVFVRGAGGSYAETAVTGATLDAYGVAWGDYDNDGDLDLAVAVNGANDYVATNDGDGTFTGGAGPADTAGPGRAVAWGDFDNDGDLDFAVANYGADNYIASNTAGAFSTMTLTGSGGDSTGVAWGDMDNDGDLDLAFSNDNGGDIVLAKNNGDGTFSTSALTGTGGNSSGIAWGDYDADGFLDLVVSNIGADAYLMRNNGAGSFTGPTPISGAGGNSSGIVWGDIDNDGKLDLALSRDGAEDELVLYGDGAGAFAVAALSDGGRNSKSLALGDVDGDGDLDIGAGSAADDEFILRNDTMTAHTAPTPPATGFTGAYSEFSEFSSSGMLTLMWDPGTDAETPADLLEYFVQIGTMVAGSSTTLKFPERFSASGHGGGFLYSTRASTDSARRGMRVLMQAETTAFWRVITVDAEQMRSATSTAQETYMVAPSAIDDLSVSLVISTAIGGSSMTARLIWTAPGDDGDTGAITGGEYDIRYSTLAPLLTASDFIGAAAAFRITAPTSTAAGAAQFYDIPYLDAATTHYFAITTKDGLGVRSALSNAATAYAYIIEALGTAVDPYNAAWADIDGDGDLDFIVTNYAAAKIKGVNNGDGTFTQTSIAGADAAQTRGLAWADFDNDGDLDAVLANEDQSPTILENDGAGGFTARTLAVDGGDAQGVAAGDFDNDGDIDFVIAIEGAAEVSLHVNEGGLSFSSRGVTAAGSLSRGIAAGDMDNDGYLDIVVANDGGAATMFLKNNGDGSFSQNVLSGLGYSRGLALGDYDADGDLDIFVANAGNQETGEDNYILRNNNGGVFSAPITLSGPGMVSYGVSLADMNGDGRLDAAFANKTGEPANVWVNMGGDNFARHALYRSENSTRTASWGDYDGDGDPDLLLATGPGDAAVGYVLRNDAAAANTAPSAPSGLSASFSEYSIYADSGTLTLMWDDSTDAESSTASLRYFPRVGTTGTGSSDKLRIPRRFGHDGYSGGGFLYSTKVSGSQRGYKIEMQKETTVYWSVVPEDDGLLRGPDSGESAVDLSAPGPITDLTAAIDTSVQTSSVAWVALTFTAPGENGMDADLQPGSLFDVRWSTSVPITTLADYEAALTVGATPHQALVSGFGTTKGVNSAWRSVAAGSPKKSYYFTMTTLDKFGSRSALSNASGQVVPRVTHERIGDISETAMLQGETTGFMRINLWKNGAAGNVKFQGLNVRKIGTLPDAAIKNVGIYTDAGSIAGTFDDTDPLKTNSAVFTSSAATLTFGTARTIGVSMTTYYLGVEFDTAFLPVEGATVSLALNGDAFILTEGGMTAIDYPGLQLDGVDDGAVAAYRSDLNVTVNPLTIEAWIRTAETRGDRAILVRGSTTAGSGYSLWLNVTGCGAGEPVFYVGANKLCAGVAVNDEEWHHVAAYWANGVGMTIFIDGLDVASNGVWDGMSDVSAGLGIGRSSAAAINDFSLSGQIDEVRISAASLYTKGVEFVPARRFTDGEATTLALYHFDAVIAGAQQFKDSGKFKDDPAKKITLTAVGTVRGHGRSAQTAVSDAQDLLVASGTDIAPSTMYENEKDIEMLRLKLWTAKDHVSLRQFFITPLGNGVQSDVENISLYLDDGDDVFDKAADTVLVSAVDFVNSTATFNLAGEIPSVEQLIDTSTKTYFIAWDIANEVTLDKTLGLEIAATSNFTLSGSTDAGFNFGYPIRSGTPMIVGAEAFVTPEAAAGVWINISSVVFRTDFSLGNVNHYRYRWNQNPADTVINTDTPIWNVGKATVTATVDSNDWYFHVRAFADAVPPVAGTQLDFGPYFIDTSPPAGSGFLSYDAAGAAVTEVQFSDLAADVTAEFLVQDSTSGLNVDGPSPVAPDSGTVSLWHFDEPTGTSFIDASGPNRNNLTVGMGTVSRTHGRFKTGLLFDGTSYLQATPTVPLPSGGAAVSVEAWVYPLSTGATRSIISWGTPAAPARLALDAGRLAIDFGSGYVAGGPALSTGVWQHVAFTFDGATGRYYLGGVEVGNGDFGGESVGAGTLYVARADLNDGSKFLGALDDVRVAATALSAVDILNDYARGDPYYVSYSRDAGNTWSFIASTETALAAHVELTGAQGDVSQETLKGFGLDLIVSTSAQTGGQATNQARFHVADVAGNVYTSAPLGILIDTNSPVAISTPTLPISGTYVRAGGAAPSFFWKGASTQVVSGMLGNFYLEAARDDETFATNVEISISTPARVSDNSATGVRGSYVSTFTLTENSTYYWRVRARSNLGIYSPWSQTASFVTDKTTPTASDFRVFNSSNVALQESENIDLLSGVTAQLTLRDDSHAAQAGLSHFATYPATTDVLGYWSFDEIGGASLLDASGNGNHGTPACGQVDCSSPTYATSRFGAGLRCNDDYRQAATFPNADFNFPAGGAFTIEAWIYPEKTSGNRIIAGMGHPSNATNRNYIFRTTTFDSDVGLMFANGSSAVYGATGTIKQNTWHHVAVTAESSRISFFVDGALREVKTLGGGNAGGGTMPFSVCAGVDVNGYYGGEFFSGIIDEVRVVGRALDPETLAADYAATAAGRYAVEYSTTAGRIWNIVSATYPVAGYPYLNISGAPGSLGPETVQVRHLDLTHSTSSQTGGLGTNQLRFIVPDRAGNRLTTNPYAVIVDTVAAAAVTTPYFPADGAFVGAQPNFSWTGPSTTTVTQMGPNSSYLLEVDDAADFFSPAISISTPVVTQATNAATVDGLYFSTHTLLDDTTYYWRVRSKNQLGLLSPPLTVFTFITDLTSPTSSGFVSYSSTYGAVGEFVVNDLAAGVTVELRLQDSALASGLSITPASGVNPFGVIYTTQIGSSLAFWIDGSWGATFNDPSGSINDFAQFGGDLYAGSKGSGDAPVFKFDGANWAAAGSALTGSEVLCLEAFNGKLYAGVNGNGRIYSWDGASWTQEFDTGQNQTNDLKAHKGRLYAATGGTGEIWAYDPASGQWYRVFDAPIDPVSALEVYNGSLFAAGQGGIYVSSGMSFTISNSQNIGFLSLQAYNDRLYTGTNNGGNVYMFNGSAWSLDFNPPEQNADALGVHDGRLYAGVNNPGAGRIYAKDGRDWMTIRQLENPVDETHTFEHYGGRLYAGTARAAYGTVFVSTPLVTTLSGGDGSLGLETLRAEGLDFTQSTDAGECSASRDGYGSCTATNQVRFTAMDRAGNVAASGPYAVLVDALLAQPTAAFPAAGEFVNTGSPVLIWDEATIQPQHDPQVASNAAMTSPPALTVDGVIQTVNGAYTVTGPLSDGATYYWRVRAYNSLGIVTDYSPVANFTVDLSSPAASAYGHLNSAQAVIAESQINNLAVGVTVQLTLADVTAGLIVSTAVAPGSHQLPAGGFGVMYSTNAGADWRSLSTATLSRSGTQESILSLAVFGDKLYAGQGAEAGDGDVFVYDGASWNSTADVPGAASVEAIYALAVYEGKLYAGQGASAGDGDVLEFNGAAWSTSYDGSGSGMRALAVYNGKLYAGQSGAAGDGDVFVYDGASWNTSYGGAGTDIRALAVYNNRLYAGGDGTGVRVFDGKNWSQTSGATADPVVSLAVFDGKLFAGTTGGDVSVFNGTSWATSFTGAQEEFLSLAVFNGRLYAGQGVDTAGDGDLYVFDGRNWTRSYDGASEGIFALAAFNGRLYAGEGATTGLGDIRSFDPLGGASLSGADGAVTPQVLTATLDLVSSTNTQVCGGSGPCGATNQVLFNAVDRAGNVLSGGPYAVIVDTSVPRPSIGALTPLTTQTVFVTAVATDNLSGIQDYLFEASTASNFGPPITGSGFVSVDSHVFTNLLVATTYYFRVSLRDNLNNISTPSVVAATSTFGTVFYSSADVSLASAQQDTNVPMLRMHLNLPSGASELRSLRVTLTGSATDQDISAAVLYRDFDGDGAYTDGTETWIAEAPFVNGISDIDLAAGAGNQTLAVQVSTFFVVYRMSPFATVGETAGLDLAVIGDVGLRFPDSPVGPFPTSVAPIPIVDGPNTVTFNESGAYPAQNAAPGTNNVLLLRLDATTPAGTSLLDEIVLHYSGDMDPNEITRVVVWRDANSNSAFEPSIDDNLTNNNQRFGALTYSTITLSAQASSRTVVQGGGETFFVTVDIPTTADSEQGKGFQITLSTPGDIHLNNPADSPALTAYPIAAGTVTIRIDNIVTVSTKNWAPATVLQGERYVVLGTTLTVDTGSAQIDEIVVNLSGLASDADVAAVEFYKDKSANGLPFVSPAAETFIGSSTFSGGVATVGIWDAVAGGPLRVDPSTTVVFLVYRVAAGATPDNTVGGVITGAGNISTVDQTSAVRGPFPIASTLTQIVETVDMMSVPNAPPVYPPQVDQGQKNVKMLSFELVSNNNDITWSGLTIERLGDALDADVEAVRIYHTSVTASNQMSGIISTDVFTGGSATIALDVSTSITQSTATFIVTLDIGPDAVTGSSIALRINTTAAFNINAPNIVSTETTPFPIITPIYVPIQQFGNTIAVTTTSIVPPDGVLPGTPNVGIMHLVMNTDVSTAKWYSLDVERLGASVNADVDRVKIYYDKTGAGVWNASNLGAYDLISTTTVKTFGDLGLNSVRVEISTVPTIVRSNVSQKGFFLVVDISDTAQPDNQIIVRAQDKTWFKTDNPNVFSAATAKFTSRALTIASPPQQMYVVGTDTAPATVTQGDTNVPMEKLELWLSSYSAKWSHLTVTRAGAGTDSDVSAVRIFDDSGTVAGELDASDLELGAATFSSGLAVLTFATQTIRVTTATYHITYDINVAAQGASVGMRVGNAGDFPLAAPHVTSNLGFPIISAESAIQRTATGLNVSGLPRSPGQLIQGAEDQPIIGLTLNTDALALLFNAVTVASSGTAADTDIAAVNLWYDVNGNNNFEAGSDLQLTAGSERFVGGLATLTILPGLEQTIETSPKNFFVTVDVAEFADDAKTFGAVVLSSSDFAVSSPNFVIDANFPAPAVAPSAQIKKVDEELAVVPADRLPAGGVNQSTEAVVAQLDVFASRNSVEWTGLRVEQRGTLNVSSITAVSLYRADDSGNFSAAATLIASTGAFVGKVAQMTMVSSETVTVATRTYYVTYTIASGAPVGETIALRIASAGSLTVTKGDSVSSTNITSFDTSFVKILDRKTPEEPRAVFTDGAFSGNFEHLEFTWDSSVGEGSIIGAEFAIGKSSGANDVYPIGAAPNVFAPLTAAERTKQAKGFGLESGATYYVSVRVQSQVDGAGPVFTSPLGVSAPIVMDFTVPPAPAPNISISGNTMLFTWASFSAGVGPSGIKGYLVEYRTGEYPTWKNAKTGGPAATQGVSSFQPAASVSSAAIVTGNAFQANNLPSGTLYVRMRAVTGAGQAGPASEVQKVLLGVSGEGLSQVSNYPNPFDSRRQKTTIHYALGSAGEATISIYSIYGRLVRSLSSSGAAGSNEVVWDGTDDNGAKVSKGMYLAVIEAGGSKVILKVGVIH